MGPFVMFPSATSVLILQAPLLAIIVGLGCWTVVLQKDLTTRDRELAVANHQNEQLNNTVRLVADHAAEQLKAAAQREQRLAYRLRECENEPDDLWDMVRKAIVWTANKLIGAAVRYVGGPATRLGLM